MKRHLPLSVAIIAALAAAVTAPAFADAPATYQPNKFVLTVKSGEVTLADDMQTIAGTVRQFDDSANNFLSIEGETRAPGERVAIGGEFMRYTNRFRRAPFSGENYDDSMRTYSLLFKAKYFMADGSVQPYVGGGVGWVQVHDFGGPIEGLASGLALHGSFGVQWRTDRVGVRAEAFLLRGNVDDDKGDEIDASVSGVLLGVSFFFGPKGRR